MSTQGADWKEPVTTRSGLQAGIDYRSSPGTESLKRPLPEPIDEEVIGQIENDQPSKKRTKLNSQFQCGQCKQEFASKLVLKEHSLQHNARDTETLYDESEQQRERNYECTICNRSFTSAQQYAGHCSGRHSKIRRKRAEPPSENSNTNKAISTESGFFKCSGMCCSSFAVISYFLLFPFFLFENTF